SPITAPASAKLRQLTAGSGCWHGSRRTACRDPARPTRRVRPGKTPLGAQRPRALAVSSPSRGALDGEDSNLSCSFPESQGRWIYLWPAVTSGLGSSDACDSSSARHPENQGRPNDGVGEPPPHEAVRCLRLPCPPAAGRSSEPIGHRATSAFLL